MATWDQRCAGASYPALDPADTLTIESIVDDTIAVAETLARRFDERQVYLVANSWARSLRCRPYRRGRPPPYDILWDYEVALSHERDWNDYRRMLAYESQGEMPANLFVGEYSLLGKLRALGAFLDTFSVLYPQLRDVDLRRSATSLDVPVFLVEGGTRSAAFSAWRVSGATRCRRR